MKNYDVKIELILEYGINAKNKKEAEEIAWYEYDQSIENGHEPTITIKEVV